MYSHMLCVALLYYRSFEPFECLDLVSECGGHLASYLFSLEDASAGRYFMMNNVTKNNLHNNTSPFSLSINQLDIRLSSC